MQAISDASFEQDVINSDIPVLVDFWAPWCGPCKSMTPILEEVSEQYAGKVKFVKLDVDQNPATPPKFNVRGIPTLILFSAGQVKATQVGSMNKADLAAFVDKNL